jgi:hypothetical protein
MSVRVSGVSLELVELGSLQRSEGSSKGRNLARVAVESTFFAYRTVQSTYRKWQDS